MSPGYAREVCPHQHLSKIPPHSFRHVLHARNHRLELLRGRVGVLIGKPLMRYEDEKLAAIELKLQGFDGVEIAELAHIIA